MALTYILCSALAVVAAALSGSSAAHVPEVMCGESKSALSLVQLRAAQTMTDRKSPRDRHEKAPYRIGGVPVYGPCGELQSAPLVSSNQTDFEPLLKKVLLSGNQHDTTTFMQKLAEGKSVNIIVLGGSFTAGMGTPRGKPDSWSARFVKWLGTAFPSAKMTYHNLAQGGSTSAAILGGIGIILRSEAAVRADLVLLDTLVNDAAEISVNSDAVGAPRSVPMRGVTDADAVSIVYEKLVRSIKTLLPHALIYSLLAGCPACLPKKSSHLKVLQHYSMPFLDYAELVSWSQDLWYPEKAHPDWITHQHVADALAYTWSMAWHKTCSGGADAAVPWRKETLWPDDKLALYSVCLFPTTAFSASGEQTTKPRVVSGNWKLFEDRPGKPGWIADSPSAKISFPIRFGEKPTLAVTWLMSYTNLGSARMSLNGMSETLSGLWSGSHENVSQSHTVWFQVHSTVHQTGDGLVGFGLPANSAAELTFELLPDRFQKFKIIEVVAC